MCFLRDTPIIAWTMFYVSLLFVGQHAVPPLWFLSVTSALMEGKGERERGRRKKVREKERKRDRRRHRDRDIGRDRDSDREREREL